jgi:hypothetical protein
MATVPNALLVCITSAYARRGEVWRTYQKHFGKDDSPVLVVQADTRTMNPGVPQTVIDAAYEADSIAAAAEYGSQFRTDVEGFVTFDAVQRCRIPGRLELPPDRRRTYVAFTDPSGGTSDSFTLAIGYQDGDRVVVAALRERPAPFDPDSVVGEFADVAKTYGCYTVYGDRYAAEWPVERFRAHGIAYRPAEKAKSDLYLSMLPRLNAGTIELLDHDKLCKQIVGLERRTARGGRDSIDHAPNAHDDLANAVAGLAFVGRPRPTTVGAARIDWLL